MKKIINHQNFIRTNINDAQFGTSTDRQIYCRKLHKITEPQMKDCASCPCMEGWMGGNGHECVWEDIIPDDPKDPEAKMFDGLKSNWTIRNIPWEQRTQEFLRVSKLIDQGILQKELPAKISHN